MIRNYNLCGRRFPLQLGVALVVIFDNFIVFFNILFVFFGYFLSMNDLQVTHSDP